MTAATTPTRTATHPAGAGGIVSGMLTDNTSLAGIATKDLRKELRARSAASKTRDTRANPLVAEAGAAGNLHGRYVETTEYLKMVRRMLRSAVKRFTKGADLDALTELADIAHDADTALREAITQLRKSPANPQGYSWTDIGVALGYPPETARQCAYTRFGLRK